MISDVRLPYEILIRFDETGAPKGAHVQYRQRLIVDGVVRADDILPAAPLSLDNMPASELMTDATRDALIAVAGKDVQIAQLISTLSQLRSEFETVTAELKTARDTAAAAQLAAEMRVPVSPEPSVQSLSTVSAEPTEPAGSELTMEAADPDELVPPAELVAEAEPIVSTN